MSVYYVVRLDQVYILSLTDTYFLPDRTVPLAFTAKVPNKPARWCVVVTLLRAHSCLEML